MKAPVIIPARAGSKGIPHKNLIELCGKPLIAWTVLQALRADCVSDVYVSTDGEEIATVSEQNGAKVIWRPESLSGDLASSESALEHAIGEIQKSNSFENVIFLQATSPLRTRNDIDQAYNVFLKGGYDSLFSMAVMDDYTLWSKDAKGEMQSISFDYRNRGRRQDRTPVFLENGSIYIFRKKLLMENHNRIGGKIGMYEMPFIHSFEIDSVSEVEICEHYLNKIIEEEDI